MRADTAIHTNRKTVLSPLDVKHNEIKRRKAAVMRAKTHAVQPYLRLGHHSAKAEPKRAAAKEKFLFVPRNALIGKQSGLVVPKRGDTDRIARGQCKLPMILDANVIGIT